MTSHSFGGPWTEIKLDAVEYYLKCYTNALAHNFDLWYVDAFAGTGERTSTEFVGGLFEGRPISAEVVSREGSARRALAIRPPFDHFVFIDDKTEHCDQLRALQHEFPNRDIQIVPGDANEKLCELVATEVWRRKRNGRARAAVFLDPYALQVDWATLKALAETQIVDVWYLFPLRDINRQLAREFSGIGIKEPMLNRILPPNWQEDLYQHPPATQMSLQLDQSESDGRVRASTMPEVEAWFRGALNHIFPYVSQSLPLLQESRQAFSLFLAVANDSQPAIDLAKRFVKFAMKQRRA